MYSINSYFVTKMMIELPIFLIIPMLGEIITYFGIGYTLTAGKFFIFYVIIFLQCMASAAFGYLISSTVN
jgi:ATP-binding cassette subfamily G (WHITE) protein 1